MPIPKTYAFIDSQNLNMGVKRDVVRNGVKIYSGWKFPFLMGLLKETSDAELIVYALTEIANYDKAIIVAGDGDYGILAEKLDGQNKLGLILAPNKLNYSSLLKPFARAGKMDYVSDLRAKLEYVK